MDTTIKYKPKTLAELLPGLDGILSKDAMHDIALTASKAPRQTITNTCTNEKVMKPLTMAELRNVARSLQKNSPKIPVQSSASAKKWNSSSKLENKTINHTGNRQIKCKYEIYKPKTMTDLLPGLDGILSKDSLQSIALTASKTPCKTMASTCTNEKTIKPLTMTELRTIASSLQKNPLKNTVQPSASVKKWNSSRKMENKIISRTENGIKRNTVRKVLNFQPPKPRPKTFASPRVPNSEITNFPKPVTKVKKSVQFQALNTIRISGICNIPESPIVMNKPIISRINKENKENIPNKSNNNKKLMTTPKSSLHKRIMAARIPDTPISNESINTSCDTSFLQNELDIDIESKIQPLEDEQHSLSKVVTSAAPISTPFVGYQHVNDFFNNSSYIIENINHDTINMSCDNTISNENSNANREESVIVSLCDMLSKATISNIDRHSTELNCLLKAQKQIQNTLKLINNINESQLNLLQHVNKLIQDKINQPISDCKKENITIDTEESPKYENILSLDSSIIGKPCSMLKTILKSPSYKIPKKNMGMRKKVGYKSMPDLPLAVSPQKAMGEKAMSMYLNLKKYNAYLNTPVTKQKSEKVLDTPVVTKNNLQKQLDKLFDDN